MRYISCLLFGIAIAWSIYRTDRRERGLSGKSSEQQLYRAEIWPYLLPAFLVLLLLLSYFEPGYQKPVTVLLPLFLKVVLHLSIYNAVLLLLLPVLRRKISARVCAMLWSMPNILYLSQNGLIVPSEPILVLKTPIRITDIIIIIWAVGALAVLLWHLAGHLLFRHMLLRNARTLHDRRSVAIWEDVQAAVNIKRPYYRLMQSPDTATPLSIGFFKKTIRVILPDREYADEELRLIFLHELIHISRQDSGSKFFMVFCAAICWFNPLMWIAVRKNAADMELSCDETVLLNQGEDVRKRYAELLLRTAGNDRGFSTCLSASAKTMLYRLTHALAPQKRHLGAIAAGVAMFLLLSTCGLVAFSYDPVTGSECIFESKQPVSWFDKAVYSANGIRQEYSCTDHAAIQEYVSKITFFQLSGSYTYQSDSTKISFYFQNANHEKDRGLSDFPSYSTIEVTLSDHMLQIITFTSGIKPEIQIYYHDTNIDWEYLQSLLIPKESQQ